MLYKQQAFYKSKKWEAFRKVFISQCTDADGYVHCAVCGKPILKPYDLIVHHKQELSDDNVDDVTIALNPDNVECVHFKCHNQIHDRFTEGHSATYKPTQKHVYIVYGSPCAGKSTWVCENATADDLIVDMDSIWQMISINDRYQKPAALKSVVFDLRDKLYDVIKYRSGKWHDAYIITGGALKGDRDRLIQRVSADDLIFIDTSEKECMNRVMLRDIPDDQKALWLDYVKEWFSSFQPEENFNDE